MFEQRFIIEDMKGVENFITWRAIDEQNIEGVTFKRCGAWRAVVDNIEDVIRVVKTDRNRFKVTQQVLSIEQNIDIDELLEFALELEELGEYE